MTANNPSPFVPKLRFPEFRDDLPWSAPLLADLYEFKRTNTLSRDKLNYETGTIRNIHYGDIHTKFNPLFQVREEHVPYVNPDSSAKGIDADAFCEEGDIVLADASEDLNDVGKAIEVVSLDGEQVVAGTHTILGTRRGSVPVVGFSGQLFQSTAVRAGIKKEAQGAKVYGISAKRISAVPIPLPPTEAEQQKIADCLGSLDDLIAAEGRKLDALREHKQGLMQQLFPQPGETVPRLRFPEFREAGDWEEGLVGDVFKVTRGEVLAMPLVRDSRSNETPFPVYSSQTKNRGLAGYYSEYLYEDAITWTTDGANAGDVNYRAGKFYCTNVCGVLINNDGQANLCTAELINSVSRQHVSFVGNPKLMNGVMAKISVPFPSLAEQQRIAACLSSLEDVLAAQDRKIDALKQQKRGLLQQLFPSLETK